MNIWAKQATQAIKQYLKTQSYQVNFQVLNSQTMIYDNPYLYLLIKTIKGQKLVLNLLAFDIAKRKQGMFTKENIKSVEIELYLDGKIKYLNSRNRESRISIKNNQNQSSYWLLTLQSKNREQLQTQVFLCKYQLVENLPPSKISLHQINTMSKQISKITFHPDSTDILVILYKNPCIDFINYVNNMNFPELQLDLQSIQFVDIQFGVKTSQIFDIYLLSKDGQIYLLQKVLINGLKLSQTKSVEVRNDDKFQFIEKFTKIQNNVIEVTIDNDEAIQKINLKKLNKNSKENKLHRTLNFQFRILNISNKTIFILIKQGQNKSNSIFIYQTLIIVNNFDLLKLEQTIVNSQLSTPFVNKVSFSIPHILQSPHPRFVYILHLNNICQLDLNNLLNMLSGDVNTLRLSLQLENTIIPFKLLGTTQQKKLQLIKIQTCGFYGVLLTQNLLFVFRNTMKGDYKLRTYYIYSELNNKQIENLKQQFKNTQNENSYHKDKNTQSKSLQLGLNTASLTRNLSSLIQTRQKHLQYIQKQIKKKQLNIFSLQSEVSKQSDSKDLLIKRRKDLSSRLKRISERSNNLLSDINNQKVIESKSLIQNPKTQLFVEKINEMKNQFDIQKNNIVQQMSLLENKVEKKLNNKVEIVQNNWTDITKLKNDLDSIILKTK